jgi:cytochrome c553
MRLSLGFAGFMSLVYAGALCAADAPAKPDLERGKQLVTTVCSACHGTDGRGTAATNPNLAGQHADYISAQLAAFKAGTRPSPIMQGMAAGLSPEDMKSVGEYYSSQKPVESMARDKVLAQRGEKLWRAGIKGINAPAVMAQPAMEFPRNTRASRDKTRISWKAGSGPMRPALARIK